MVPRAFSEAPLAFLLSSAACLASSLQAFSTVTPTGALVFGQVGQSGLEPPQEQLLTS